MDQASEHSQQIAWTATEAGLTTRLFNLSIRIVKVPVDRAIDRSRTVLAFSPMRYRAFVEEAVVDTDKVFFDSQDEAKEKAIALAEQIRDRIAAQRQRHRAALLSKLGLIDDTN
jgi:hypothetical protein